MRVVKSVPITVFESDHKKQAYLVICAPRELVGERIVGLSLDGKNITYMVHGLSYFEFYRVLVFMIEMSEDWFYFDLEVKCHSNQLEPAVRALVYSRLPFPNWHFSSTLSNIVPNN